MNISNIEWVAYPSDQSNINLLNEINKLKIISKNVLEVNSGLFRYSYEIDGEILDRVINQIYYFRAKYLEVQTTVVLDSTYDYVSQIPHIKTIAMAWLSNLLDVCITKIIIFEQSPHPGTSKVVITLKPLSKKDTPIYSDKSIPTLDPYKDYMFLSTDPLVYYLEPEFLTIDNEKLEIKIIPFTNISLIRLPVDWNKLNVNDRNAFFESVNDAREDLLGIRSRGVFSIPYKHVDDKHIIMMLAELWNFEVFEHTVRGNKLLNTLVLQTGHKLRPFFPTNFYNIPTECSKIQEAGMHVSLSGEINGINISSKVIIDWFNHNVDLIKNDNLPEYTLYGIWQLYSKDLMPNIIAVAQITYLQLFPDSDRIPIHVGPDGSIRASFLTIDDLILYKNRLDDHLGVYITEGNSTSMSAINLETAFNYRLQNPDILSVIVEYESVIYTVFFEKNTYNFITDTHPMLSLIFKNSLETYGWIDFTHQNIKIKGVIPKIEKLHRTKPGPDYKIKLLTDDNKKYFIFVHDEHSKYADDKDLFLGSIINTTDDINTITENLQHKWNKGKMLDFFASTYLKITGKLPLYTN